MTDQHDSAATQPRRRPRSLRRHERRAPADRRRRGRNGRPSSQRHRRKPRARRAAQAHRLAPAPPHLAHGARRLPAARPAHHRRLSHRLPARRHPARQPPPPPRATSTSTPTAPSCPRRRGQPGERPAQPDPRGPARGARRRGPRLLLRVGRRPQGDGPRRLEHRHRQGQAVRLDHHPAVREELLPGPGTDGHPQGEGVLHRDQAGPRGEQGRHPRGLPQHQLLRPQRLRHPGRRPGLLRQGRRQADTAQGAYLAALLNAPSAYDVVAHPENKPRPSPAGTTSSTAWSRRTGSAARREQDELPRRPRRPRPPPACPASAATSSRPQGLPHQQQDHRRAHPGGATASPPPSTKKAGRLVEAVGPADGQARQGPQGRPYVRAGGASTRPPARSSPCTAASTTPSSTSTTRPAATTRSAPPSSRSSSPPPSRPTHHPGRPPITPNTIYDGNNKRPVAARTGPPATPPNEDDVDYGDITVTTATDNSVNAVYAQMAVDVGPPRSAHRHRPRHPREHPRPHASPPSRLAPPPPASWTWPRRTPPSPTTASTAPTPWSRRSPRTASTIDSRRRTAGRPSAAGRRHHHLHAAERRRQRHRHRRAGRRPPGRGQDRHREDQAAWFAGYTPTSPPSSPSWARTPQPAAQKPLYGAPGLARINGGGTRRDLGPVHQRRLAGTRGRLRPPAGGRRGVPDGRRPPQRRPPPAGRHHAPHHGPPAPAPDRADLQPTGRTHHGAADHPADGRFPTAGTRPATPAGPVAMREARGARTAADDGSAPTGRGW